MIQDTNTKDEDLISDIRKDTDNDLDSESGGAGDPGVHPNQHQVTREPEATKEFVAPWILSNFPDITSETALQSQAASPDNRRRQCEECCAVYATFECEDCALALCFKCTDAIHIIPTLSTHAIHLNRFSIASQPESSAPESTQELARVATTRRDESVILLPAGTHVFFRASDCSRWSRELLHGTLTSREPATTSSGGVFYQRVLWLRGVEALPNGFFRATLTLPGWDISSDTEVDIGETFWPHDIGVFPTHLGAFRAVVTAEQVGRDKFRRELQGGRIHRWRGENEPDAESESFPSSEILEEIVAETAATLGSEFNVRLTRQDDVVFYRQLAQCTWNYQNWMKSIGRLGNLREEAAVPFEFGVANRNSMLEEDPFNDEWEKPVPTPWAPATRIRYFMVAQQDLVYPERVCRQHLRAILDQLMFVYAGFAWKLWSEFVDLHREREEKLRREHSACILQSWTRRIAERKRQKERQDLLSLAIGSSLDALELYRRQQLEARKLYAFLTRQMDDKKRRFLRIWRENVGPSDPPPPPATAWHPSHGMKAMLPKLPRIGARRRTAQDKAVAVGTQVIIEDMATYKLFKANHAGPADTSYWVIRARVLAGSCPIGPAFREARRLVSRTDFATSVLLQQISVFVCLMEPEELKTLETAEGSSNDNEWSYERQVRDKYQVLCRELKGAETVSKRHVELAKQTLIEFDREVANASAASIGSTGNKRRASLTLLQQQHEDTVEEAKTNAAREALEQKRQLAEQQVVKATHELTRLGMMELEFLYFPIEHDEVPDSEEMIKFLQKLESRLRSGKNMYIFSRFGHGRTGLMSALLLGRVYGITSSEALERSQRVHDCQRPGAPRGLSFCSPTTAPQLAFVRRALAHSMDPIYVPLVLENSTEKFRSTRVQQRGLLAEPYLKDEGFMVSAAGDAKAREQEALEQKRLERIARRESAAAALQCERRRQKKEHETMESEDGSQAIREVITKICDLVEDGRGS